MAKKKIDITIAAKTKIKSTLLSIGQSFKKLATVGAAAGVAIGAALFNAAKRSQQLNKQLGQIATLSSIPIRKVKAEIKGLSVQLGVAKDELTQGLYQALSAGVPEDNALSFLENAAKAGIAGAASTAEAVDILTTTLNAFKIPASQAAAVSDVLFTTVKLGKTTLGELSASLSQVAPLAAASGVSIQEVAAATATLTKQGTPTAQAMTQIRAAIIAMNDKLGDGWARTMTLQEGMAKMAEKAGGSATKLKELTGRVEGSLAILATTGDNARGAAEDLQAMANSAGAADEAFSKMEGTNPLEKIMQGLDNIRITVGDKTLEKLSDQLDGVAESLDRVEKRGLTEEFAEDMSGAFAEAAKGAGLAAKAVRTVWAAHEVLFRIAKGENIKEALGAIHARNAARDWREFGAAVRESRIAVQEKIKAGRASVRDFFESKRPTAEDHQAVEDMFAPKKKGKDPQAIWAPFKKVFEQARDAQRKLAEEKTAQIEAQAQAQQKAAQAQETALNNEIAALEKSIGKRATIIGQLDKMAARNVGAFIQEAKNKKAAGAAVAKEDRKIARIRAKQDRNIILGKKDQEFIDAVDKRGMDRIVANVAKGVQDAEVNKLEKLNAQRDALAQKQATDIEMIRKNLQASLNVGGNGNGFA